MSPDSAGTSTSVVQGPALAKGMRPQRAGRCPALFRPRTALAIANSIKAPP